MESKEFSVGEIIEKTNNWSNRNSANANSSEAIQDVVKGEKAQFSVIACAIMDKPDFDTGETKRVGIIKTDNGMYYSTISPTALQSFPFMIDIINEESKVDITVISRKSKGQRDFLSIIIAD